MGFIFGLGMFFAILVGIPFALASGGVVLKWTETWQLAVALGPFIVWGGILNHTLVTKKYHRELLEKLKELEPRKQT